MRTKFNYKMEEKDVSAILAADLHLREDQPICRTDDYFLAQERKIKYIKELQIKYKVPVLISGDIFHHWKPSPFLLAWALKNLPDNIICIPGQHDLPQHQIDLIYKSGLGVLERAGKIQLITNSFKFVQCNGFNVNGFPFGTKPFAAVRDVVIWHNLVWTGKTPWPGCEDPNADDVLDSYPNANLILTGDNHKQFIVKRNNQILVNPGSMMRMSADQDTHIPCVFLWSKKLNLVESVPLPIDLGVINREHIEEKEIRDKRINAFISRLSNSGEIGLSFEGNLNKFISANTLHKEVISIINQVVFGE